MILKEDKKTAAFQTQRSNYCHYFLQFLFALGLSYMVTVFINGTFVMIILMYCDSDGAYIL